MKPDVYMNSRGEVVMSYEAFRAANSDAIAADLAKHGGRRPTSRRHRRYANGSITKEHFQRLERR